ncbi:hydrogenase 2 small subunit [Candidatus Magnetomoraceae bacterium gMMP-13]
MIKNIFDVPEIDRREFLKVSGLIAASLGLSSTWIPKIADAFEKKEKQPVIWLHFQECTGCTEALLRTRRPDLLSLLVDTISLEYHETLFAAAGTQIENQLHSAMKRYSGKYVVVVEGSIPTKENGIYCMIAGQTARDMLKKVASKAAAIIAIGSCASWGGISSSGPNPTGAVGVKDIISDKPIINIPGCPPNPHNFLSTVVHFLLLGKLPKLDEKGRPLFAYGTLIHDQCERRSHFNAGRFALKFGDEGHRKGYCLYKLGCKGPSTYANCPEIGFNREKTWPVSVGHPCFGCVEDNVGFNIPLHQESEVLSPEPSSIYPEVSETKKQKISPASAAIAGAATGAAITAGLIKIKNLPDSEEKK